MVMEISADLAARETIETLRQLTLQVMLISAGVFGIVGGFVSATDKAFRCKAALGIGLGLLALSALAGYLLHGGIISLLHAGRFDPFDSYITVMGVLQIGTFVAGGISFAVFVYCNVRNAR
jgi:hypothetical protein